MNELRDAYFEALGTRDSKKLRAALDRSHDIRKFEIELYWKRATYFWVLQAAAFTAFGFTWQVASDGRWAVISVAFACLGILTSLAGLLVAQGSKFWQNNWELHIDMLEDAFEGKLHKTIWIDPYGVRWSVSGINDHLSFCFFGFWILITFFAISHGFGDTALFTRMTLIDPDPDRSAIALTLLATVAGCCYLLARISRIHGIATEIDPELRGPLIQRFPRFGKRRDRKSLMVKREVSP